MYTDEILMVDLIKDMTHVIGLNICFCFRHHIAIGTVSLQINNIAVG
jgi:hypothetical protein